jgi:hypothetical protein
LRDHDEEIEEIGDQLISAGSLEPFLELTASDPTLDRVYVNYDNVRFLRQHKDGRTTIVFSELHELTVQESVSEIFGELEDVEEHNVL